MNRNVHEAFEARMGYWLSKKRSQAPTKEAKLVIGRIRALILRGGKRIRPHLLILTYEAYSGRAIDSLIDVGMALEFHHQFLLIHDDLMDKDTVRYDGPNIVGYYTQDAIPGTSNIPDAMGLLAGDILFTFANQVVLENPDLSDRHKLAILQLMHDANLQVGYGQQLDVFNISTDFAYDYETRLLITHALKSASYSTVLPMGVAAEMLGLDKSERQKITTFAKQFGILYQLIDDYADYFQSHSSFNNRPKYRDFRQGKVTLPLYQALQLANQGDTSYLKQHLGDKLLRANRLDRAVAILEKSGAQKECIKLINRYAEKADASLAKLRIANDSRAEFQALIKNLLP